MYNPNLPPSPSDKNINEIQTNLDPMKRAVKEIIKNGTNPFEIGGGLDKKLIACQEMISSGELIITYSDPEKNGEQELNSETDGGALHTALEVIKNGGFSNVKFELINKVVSHLLKVMKNTDNFDLEKSGFDPENPNVIEAWRQFCEFKEEEKQVLSKRAETVIGIALSDENPLIIANHTGNLSHEQKEIFQSELFMHLTSVVINDYQNGTPIDISVVVWSGSETKVLTAIDLLNDFRTNAILNSIVSGEKQILSIIPAKKETVSQAPQQPQPSPEAQKSDLDNFLAEAMRNPNQISNLNLNELINYFSRLNPAQNPREIQSLNSNYDKLADLRIPRSDGGFTTGKLLATDPQDYKLVVFKDKDGKYAFKIL
jgi:hypothetical protein